MNHYLIVCRSVTYAQRLARALQRAGIAGHIVRIPQGLVSSGCGYAVRVREQERSAALRVAMQLGVRPAALFLYDGISYTEVPL